MVAATGKFRVMAVTLHATGLLENIEITSGKAGPNSYGGGIYSQGALTLSHDSLTGNTAGAGGAVEDFPGLSMTITDSTLDGNHAAANGGALDVNQQITVSGSTLASNEAGGKAFKGMGAAAELDGGGTLIVSDSTIAGNTTQPVLGAGLRYRRLRTALQALNLRRCRRE